MLFGWSVCTNHRFGWHDNFAQTVVSNGTNDILSLVQFCGRSSSIVESCPVTDTGILIGLPHMDCFLFFFLIVPRRSNADTGLNAGGRWTVGRGTRDPFFVTPKQLNRQVFNPYDTNGCRDLQTWMTEAKGLKKFCQGIVSVGGGGQYTGRGHEQPEQERPEQGVVPKPTNRGNRLGTMLHQHHSMMRFLVTATNMQSIRNNHNNNNNNNNKTMMMIMTMMPDRCV